MAYDYRSSLNQEFDVARQKAKQQEAANVQTQRDALARRQAQLGGGPGGAFIKAEQNAQDESAKRLGEANAQIDAAQRGELRRIAETDEARAYQTGERKATQRFARGEREAGQQFSSAERAAAQKFARGERMSTQDWQALQAVEQRSWATGEREAGQKYGTSEREASQLYGTSERQASETFQRDARRANQEFQAREAGKARDWQAEQNEIAQAIQGEQWAQQFELAVTQFDHEKVVDQFNMDMAEKIFNKKDFLESAMGQAGGAWGDIRDETARWRWGSGSGASTGGDSWITTALGGF